jgi:putative membrane protein
MVQPTYYVFGPPAYAGGTDNHRLTSVPHSMADFYSVLPHLNATLNASSFVLLSSGYYFIRQKRVIAHRNCQTAALTASVLFLISYIVYHLHHGATRFAGQGIVRPIYFTILTTHTILAVVIVPFVIITVRRAMRGDFLRHKAIARWTLPMWLYVSITGVVVYLMLYHLYPSH